MHDIIDNRNQKLADSIRTILQDTTRAHFAVGYLFLSGLEAIGDKLSDLQELRLLIGNTTNRETIELLAEGYRRLELMEERLEAIKYAKKSDQRDWVRKTAENVRESIEVMDQTDEGEKLIQSIIKLIAEKKLKVRVYTKGRLHAKAYIFDYKTPNPGSSGIAIVGSSNLTLSGVSLNTELNVLVHDNASAMDASTGNHAALVNWFDDLWGESMDFDTHLMNELKQSWASALTTPHDIYMKTLYTLVQDRLEGTDLNEILWDDLITQDLADFQKVAVRQAIQMIRDNGGCFVADVVGLGKSYIGAGIIKHFERTEHSRALIICPKPLEEMWTQYNEIYQLNAHVLSMSLLQTDENRGVNLLTDIRFRDRDFVLIDESHNFRHHTSQRYEELQGFLSLGRKVCLLTATPRNSRALDVYNQIKLFHPDDITSLPIDPPNLKEYFKKIDEGERRLQDILSHTLIRRTRRHILRWYGFAEDSESPLRSLEDENVAPYLDGTKRAYVMVSGRRQFFPKRELEALRYSIEDTYNGLYGQIRQYLGQSANDQSRKKTKESLSYARYGLWRYVHPDKRQQAPYNELRKVGTSLRGLIRTNLFKRFESSVEAFRKTLQRMIRTHEMFLKALAEGYIPAGDDAKALLGKSGLLDDDDLLDAIGLASGKYKLQDFDSDLLTKHTNADLILLRKMLSLVVPISPDQDDKLQTFLQRLEESPIQGNKCLIFTQYSDTAEYIYENLNNTTRQTDVEVIVGGDKSKARVVRRFSPNSNRDGRPVTDEEEIRLLVATDVLAEGLNLQDCSIVMNYDLHWNPVRLIQRFGRIDRIGSEHDTIYGMNFLPETALEKELGIHTVLARRIAEIHETIGEDAAILDSTEQLNEEAMYAMYAPSGTSRVTWEDEELMDLNEAEEYFRALKKDDLTEFERIAGLRDGIRSSKESDVQGLYAFCQAGGYNKLYLQLGDGSEPISDIPRVLEHIVTSRDASALGGAPTGFNKKLMNIRNMFTDEVKRARSMREHTLSLRVSQRYVIKELRSLYLITEDEDEKSRIDEMERAFRLSPTSAVLRELNFLRANGITGQWLLGSLVEIYHQHHLSERLMSKDTVVEKIEIPRIICSEALMMSNEGKSCGAT